MKKYVLIGVGIFCTIFLYLLYSPPDISDFPICSESNIDTLETDLCVYKEIEYFGRRTNIMCEMTGYTFCDNNACMNIDPDLHYEDAECKACIESVKSNCENGDNSSCVYLVKGRQDSLPTIQTIEICDQLRMLLYKHFFNG